MHNRSVDEFDCKLRVRYLSVSLLNFILKIDSADLLGLKELLNMCLILLNLFPKKH